MEFSFETVYDRKAMTAKARVLRKTVRKKSSRRSHVFGWIVLVLLAVLIWGDAINGWVAQKRMVPGTGKSVSVFSEENYHSVTDLGETTWHYDKILAVAETPVYFVFLFSKNHAQVYDKRTLSGGTEEEFRSFIREKPENPYKQFAEWNCFTRH